MAAVLDGRRLYARRAELQDVIAVTDAALAAALTGLIEDARPAGRTPTRAAISRRPWRRQPGRATGRSCPTTRWLRLAAALTDPQVRDTLYALAVGEQRRHRPSRCGPSWLAELPEPWRVEALVLLAFSAYARGDGPLAGVSLEAALRCDAHASDGGHAGHRTAVGDAARADPRAGHTGYRLADRLGVRLPPRRVFGRRAG